MTKFNKYASELDKIARAAFAEYQTAQERLSRAETQRKQYPMRQGAVTADYTAHSARAQADYAEAVAEVERVRRKMQEGEYQQQIANLRADLAAKVRDTYSVDPAQIDEKTLALLQSGIMGVSDFERLMNHAVNEGNITMLRLACKYAGDAADKRVANTMYGNDDISKQLRALSMTGDQYTGSAIIEGFDSLSYTFNRCAYNPFMISAWDEMTAGMVERF